MSFSWSCTDEEGHDLFQEFDIHYQGLGLAPNAADDTPAVYRLNEIRNCFEDTQFKDKYEGAARQAILDCKRMLKENLERLENARHCETCTCKAAQPNWDMEQIKRFLSIPIERIWRADGGF